MELDVGQICLVNRAYIVLGRDDGKITVFYQRGYTQPVIDDNRNSSNILSPVDILIKGEPAFSEYGDTGYPILFGALIILESLIKYGDTTKYEEFVRSTYTTLQDFISQ
jgi:hypothetical protein